MSKKKKLKKFLQKEGTEIIKDYVNDCLDESQFIEDLIRKYAIQAVQIRLRKFLLVLDQHIYSLSLDQDRMIRDGNAIEKSWEKLKLRDMYDIKIEPSLEFKDLIKQQKQGHELKKLLLDLQRIFEDKKV